MIACSFLLSFSSVGQTSIDDIHIASREISPPVSIYGAGTAARLDNGSLIRTSSDLVLVPVSITDNNNHPVLGLDQQNFQIFENKKSQPIAHFSSDDAPASIGIIVDTSSSMADKLDWARESVVQFCEAANPQDEFFMITFSDEPRLATDFTGRTQEIEDDLLTSRSKGETALLDAIYMGVEKLRHARYGRRALLILSDGGDNHSRYSEHDVKAAIREGDATIYSVGIFDRYFNTPEERLGPDLLRSIAELTGGTAFTLNRLSEMPDVTRVIGSQLRHEYMIAYHPQIPPHDGRWHKINVKLSLPKAFHTAFFHVSARSGYYGGGE